MGGQTLEQDIIGLYSSDISSVYSINQIASRLGKTYPYINKKVTSLIKEEIFKRTIVGRSHLCSLNLRNDETIYLLILSEIRKKKRELERDPELKKVHTALERLNASLGLVLCMKLGDEITIVCDTEEKRALVETNAIINSHRYDFRNLTKAEFMQEMLERRELHEKHVLLMGFEKYYEIVRQLEDELKIRYSRLVQ